MASRDHGAVSVAPAIATSHKPVTGAHDPMPRLAARSHTEPIVALTRDAMTIVREEVLGVSVK